MIHFGNDVIKHNTSSTCFFKVSPFVYEDLYSSEWILEQAGNMTVKYQIPPSTYEKGYVKNSHTVSDSQVMFPNSLSTKYFFAISTKGILNTRSPTVVLKRVPISILATEERRTSPMLFILKLSLNIQSNNSLLSFLWYISWKHMHLCSAEWSQRTLGFNPM